MKKIDRRIVIVISLIFIVGLSYGLMRFLISQKAEPPARRTIEARRYVEADIIKYDEVLSPISEPGRMSSFAEIDLSAEASGKIIRGDISLKKGSSFKKGDVIFSIYPDEAKLALKAKKSQFLNSLALLLPDIAIDFEDYENKFTSFFSSISIDNPLPSFPEVKEEKLQIFLSSKNILSDYYSIQKDELQLSRYIVRAPFSGTLTDVFLEAGAYTGMGGRVAHAIQTDLLELEVPLMRFDAAWVKIGDKVVVISENKAVKWTGVIKRKSQFVDESTQSQNVYVSIDNNTNHVLMSGEYLSATFPDIPVDNVMEIPRNAVFNTDEVFIVENKRLQNKTINIVKINTRTLLFNGLNEGDTLVTQPLINVYEGTIVTTSLDPKGPDKQEPGPGNISSSEKSKPKKQSK